MASVALRPLKRARRLVHSVPPARSSSVMPMGREAVADFVGDGEVLVLAGGGAQVDHERHEFGEQVVGAAAAAEPAAVGRCRGCWRVL